MNDFAMEDDIAFIKRNWEIYTEDEKNILRSIGVSP